MYAAVLLLLLSLVREGQVADPDCRNKLCAESPGIDFVECVHGSNNRTTPPQDKKECIQIECTKEYVFENKECEWYDAPDDVEYIAITDIDIKGDVEVKIFHLTDSNGDCKILKLTSEANQKHKIIIQLQGPKRKFKIAATKPTATLRFKCNKARLCVKMENERMRRMVRGEITDPNEFPFMVRLESVYSFKKKDYTDCNNDSSITNSSGINKECNDNEVFVISNCGGSIINNRWILTAAHCVVPESIHDEQKIFLIGVLVHLGDHMISGARDENKEKTLWVSTKKAHLKVHKKYLEGNAVYDIALLQLNEDIMENKKYRYPICLAPSNMDDLIECKVQAAGWGKTLTEKVSDKLRKQKGNEFEIVNNNLCGVTSKLLFCYKHEETNPYRGDSGGPVFCDSANDYYYQVGVIEGGRSITKGTPSRAVSVPKFLKWINERAGLLP